MEPENAEPKVRAPRSDKGKPRVKSDARGEREVYLDWFAQLGRDEQTGVIRDMSLIQRYALPGCALGERGSTVTCK